jgi:hypothetical protein
MALAAANPARRPDHLQIAGQEAGSWVVGPKRFEPVESVQEPRRESAERQLGVDDQPWRRRARRKMPGSIRAETFTEGIDPPGLDLKAGGRHMTSMAQ